MKWTVALALLALSAQAQPADLASLRKELTETETALMKARYNFPDCATAEWSRLAAKPAGETTAVPMANGQPSMFRLMPLQLGGRGDFLDVYHMKLFRRVASSTYPLDFESFHLEARDGGTVSFEARLVAACWDSTSPALDVKLVPAQSAVATEAAMYRDRLAKLRAAIATAHELDERMHPERARDALAVVSAAWGEHAVRVSDIDYRAPALKVRGVALGAAARNAVEHALRSDGFEGAHIDWSPAGNCRAFTATARVTSGHGEARDLVPHDIFAERTSSLCTPAPSGPAVKVAAHGSGELTLHARGADVAGVMLILNELSPADGFVVAPDVHGAMDVDFDGVTMDEALSALRSAGVAIATTGSLHRVCKTTCGELASQTYDGEPVSFSVTGADAADILGSFEMITSLKMRVPRDLNGTVSIYAQDTPWDLVLASLVSSLRLTHTIKDGTIYLGTNTVPLASLTRSSSRRALTERKLANLGTDDVRLAAIAGANGSWRAYAHVPGSPALLLPLTAESKLFDASVATIAADKVTLWTKSGREVVLTVPQK